MKTGSVTDAFLRLKLRGLLNWLRVGEWLGRMSVGGLGLPSCPGFMRAALAAVSLGLMGLPVLALVVG